VPFGQIDNKINIIYGYINMNKIDKKLFNAVSKFNPNIDEIFPHKLVLKMGARQIG